MDQPTAREPEPDREQARFWRHRALPDIDLLTARYIHHTFSKHTHDTFVVAAVTSGVEEFYHGGSMLRVGPGEVALVNPDTVHTGHAGVPEGWRYQVLYPEVTEVAAVAEELGRTSRGGLAFSTPLVPDPVLARLVVRVHEAAERDNALAASTAWRSVMARIAGAYLTPMASLRAPASEGRTAVRRARELLTERLAEPPTLEELAAEVGARPFPLLRAFRAEHGLPPHAWLTQERVRVARRLLDAGLRPAEAAVEVGFVDQSHLTRHFRRAVGVPPGAYARHRAG